VFEKRIRIILIILFSPFTIVVNLDDQVSLSSSVTELADWSVKTEDTMDSSESEIKRLSK